MKLLYIANMRFPTEKVHGMQVAKMIEAFQELGHSVELIVPRMPTKETDPVRFYDLKTQIDVRQVWTLPWRSSRVSFLISSFLFGIMSALVAMRRPGIIYSVDLDHFSFFLMPFLGKPYFFEIHSAIRKTIPHRLLFSRIGGIVAINENVKRALEEVFPKLRGKILIFPNGVDIKIYEDIIPRKMKHPAVVYTGSFQGWKGLQTAVEAAKLLPKVEWYFVGGEAKGLGKSLPVNVHTIPWHQSPKTAPEWQSGADMLLLSGTNKNKYSSRYTSPVKVYEYMAAGKPIIAARTSALKQVISEKEAFFYEPDDANSLSDTVKKALTHPEDFKEEAEKLKEHAKKFTWENRAKQITEFMHKQTS